MNYFSTRDQKHIVSAAQAIACGLAVGGDCLTTFAASALLALATKNFCRSYCNGFGFDAIFRASLYIGLLPLVATAAAPLLILLPLALIFSENSMTNLQTVSIIAAFPVGIIMLIIITSFFKDADAYLKEQDQNTKS